MLNLKTAAAKNSMLDHLGTLIGFLSLHSAFPSTTGASEISGGSPAYARKAVTWNAAASGNLDNNANPVFDVPASTTITWIGEWSAATAGTFYGSSPLNATGYAPFVSLAADDLIRCDNHGFVDGECVVVLDTAGAVLPTGLTEGTTYFVRDATTDNFKLAATSGGTAIDLTADGGGFVVKTTPETFGAQGTYTVSDYDISMAA